MKRVFFALLCFPLAVFAQLDEGVKFEHLADWEAVLSKAKFENKHIFVDCYTTWCGPCKYMTKEIFPQKAVGDFYNKNFVNVKVQMDQTKNDDDWVKSWYGVAEMIAKKYSVTVYPTFLVFNPDGKIVHRIIGSDNAEGMIIKGTEALSTDKQYYTVLETKLKSDNLEDLLVIAKSAQTATDMETAEKSIEKYLSNVV